MNTMTDHELETVKQHCYAEGRADEAEACAHTLHTALLAMTTVYDEVAGKSPPTDPNSYLPPRIVDLLSVAIRVVKEAAPAAPAEVAA